MYWNKKKVEAYRLDLRFLVKDILSLGINLYF